MHRHPNKPNLIIIDPNPHQQRLTTKIQISHNYPLSLISQSPINLLIFFLAIKFPSHYPLQDNQPRHKSLKLRVVDTDINSQKMSKADQTVQSPQYALVKQHIQKYAKPDDKKAWMSLAISFAEQAIVILLIKMGLGIIGWFCQIFLTVRFFIQFHDMAHFSFFESMKMNTIVGKIFGIYQHFPFNAWRDGHNHHHKHYGNLDRADVSQTILFTKKEYEEMKGMKKVFMRLFREPLIYFFISIPFIWFFQLFYIVAKRYGVFSLTFLEKILSIVLFVWVLPAFGIPPYTLWFIDYLSQVLGTVLFHMEHSINVGYRARTKQWSHTRAALEGSTYLPFGFFLKLFSCGIEYHHIHHLNTNVPGYNLAQCHDDFQALSKDNNKWDEYHINRVSVKMAINGFWNVMYDEENNTYVPFDYKFF